MPLGFAFITYSCCKSDFGDLERPRSPGDDLENAPCGYSVYQFDVAMLFKISILLYLNDLNSLIEVDLHLQI